MFHTIETANPFSPREAQIVKVVASSIYGRAAWLTVETSGDGSTAYLKPSKVDELITALRPYGTDAIASATPVEDKLTEATKPAGPKPLSIGDRVAFLFKTSSATGQIVEAGNVGEILAIGMSGRVVVWLEDGRRVGVPSNRLVRLKPEGTALTSGDQVIVKKPHAFGGTVGEVDSVSRPSIYSPAYVSVKLDGGSIFALAPGDLAAVDELPEEA